MLTKILLTNPSYTKLFGFNEARSPFEIIWMVCVSRMTGSGSSLERMAMISEQNTEHRREDLDSIAGVNIPTTPAAAIAGLGFVAQIRMLRSVVTIECS